MIGKHKKNIFIVMTIIIMITIITILSAIYIFNQQIKLNSMNFAETKFSENLILSDVEKNNINEFLKNSNYVDNDIFGFTVGTKVNFYDTYYLMCLLKTLNVELSNNFKFILKDISMINILDLNMLDLIYYVGICELEGIYYNKVNILNRLESFYDNDEKLFFAFTKNDLINTKLMITAKVVESISVFVDISKFNLEHGVENVYMEYIFKSPNLNDTLFNSGGNIIYAMNILNKFTDNIKNEKKQWFSLWERSYEKMNINSIQDAILYINFTDIENIFYGKYKTNKLQNFYNLLKTDQIDEIQDFQILFNLLTNVNKEENSKLVNNLKEKIYKIAHNFNIYINNIDVQSTFYGVLLAMETDYDIDKQKINNLIQANYKNLFNLNDINILSDTLYYNIMLDIKINNGITINKTELQYFISYILKNLKYKEKLVNDIHITRKMLNIASHLKYYNINIYLNNYNLITIKNAIKYAIKTEADKTYLITDLYIINYILDIKLIEDDQIVLVNNALTYDGGISINKNEKPDIITTYYFISCLDYIDLSSLESKKLFVEKLNTKEGIYKGMNDKNYIGLDSIYYGNIIKNLIGSGDK